MYMYIIFFIILYVTLKFFRKKNPIDNFPGPRSIPIFGNTLKFLIQGSDAAFWTFVKCAKLYYPTYRTWQGSIPVIHPLDPKDLERILSSSVHINKSHDYRFLKPWLGDGLLLSTGQKWHSRRKLLTNAFHFAILEQFIPVFNEKSNCLVKILENKLKNGEDKFNIVPYITRCTLDIICETAMGTTINAQESYDTPYVNSVYKINDIIIKRMLRPWLYPNWIFKLTKLGKQHDECLKVLHNFSNQIIADRKKERNNAKFDDTKKLEYRKKRFAFLDLLLEESEKNDEIRNEDIRAEVDTFMFEGHDTTAMALCWILHYLSKHSSIQEKCVDEIRSVFDNLDREPVLSDCGKLPYLERVIKESLRLKPSVVYMARALTENFNIGGQSIPSGTKINVHIYDIHRDPEVYPNPEQFDPDRFLPENSINRNTFSYIPFSAGPRNCIGQRFAILEEKIILITLLQKFKFSNVDYTSNDEISPNILIRPKNGIMLSIENRI